MDAWFLNRLGDLEMQVELLTLHYCDEGVCNQSGTPLQACQTFWCVRAGGSLWLGHKSLKINASVQISKTTTIQQIDTNLNLKNI
jgi:hypothetical protein